MLDEGLEHHGHHHHEQHPDNPVCQGYVNRLFCIELLRYANLENADLQLAYQYGVRFNKAWKDNEELIHQFLHTHHAELRKFINYKLLMVVKKLLDGMCSFGTPDYHLVSLDPQVVNSIFANMDNMNHVTEFQKKMTMHYGLDVSKTTPPRQMHNEFTDFEITDRLLCGVFDTYKENNLTVYSEKNRCRFGHRDVEILNNKTHLCFKCLAKCFDIQMKDWYQNKLYDNFAAWASIFSTFYRLVTPVEMHPGNLEHMYEHAFLKHHDKCPVVAEALIYGSKFSTATLEAVADVGLPELCCEFESDTVLPHKYSIASVYPHSLVEKYLVTEYVVEKCRQRMNKD